MLQIAQNSSLTLDSLHIMKLEDFLDIAASHQLPIEAIERRISELLQVSDIISEERKELEDIARHGYKFDGIGSSSMEQDHDKGLEIPSETMSNSSKGDDASTVLTLVAILTNFFFLTIQPN